MHSMFRLKSIYRQRPAAFAVALALGALFGGQASTQSFPSGTGGGSPDEIERFCGNVIDAARDRRYAIQAEELQTLQKQVDERIRVLEEKRAEYEEWLGRRNAFLAQAEQNLVQIYSKMRPDAAAGQLGELRAELAAGILMKLEARQASVILNEMETKAAAVLTSIMASAVRTEDPS